MNYGIWYDNGRIDFGWLSEEGSHGRPYRYETNDLEEAMAKARFQTEHDKNCVFFAEPIDGDATERFKRVHKLALEKRLRDAEALVESLKRMLARP